MSTETPQLSIKSQGPTITFPVKVVPGSSRTQIVGLYGTSLKVKISAPPEKGKANKELTKFLAKIFAIPASAISVTSGQTNPNKEITCEGITTQTAIEKLKQKCPQL